MTKGIEEIDEVVIKFAGDSGDGMQLTGSQFSNTTAFIGNDLSTFPDFPAEIRAPQGTVAGVSGFKIQFGNTNVYSPGDKADVLIAMNPAALKANLDWIKHRGTIIIDSDSFKSKDFEKAQFTSNPLEDGTLEEYNLIEAPITKLTKDSVAEFDIENKSRTRSKNMFALGIVYWLFSRPLNITEDFLDAKFKKNPELAKANKAALKAGYNYALTVELLPSSYKIKAATLPKGKYRSITGNIATAWGFLAAAENSGLKLFLGSYPITPASDILHELSKHKGFDVISLQAEDEIAGICSAIGASFAGSLAITTTSGPGLALKGEAIGLAMMTELPIVIVDVQRGGPSTGLPTKTEQSDLLQAVYGRNGESPVIVIAASTPANCFDYAYMASKLAVEHMTPVLLLTDGFIANGAEPWRIKNTKDLPQIEPSVIEKNNPDSWKPYLRDDEKLARKWAVPGTKGFEHRIGGLEKQEVTGNVSYDPANHENMVKLRAEKVKKVADFIPHLEVLGEEQAELLIVGWGGTQGSLLTAYNELKKQGKNVAFAHFNYINPLPKNTAEIFANYKNIVVCELNLGQFVKLLRSELPQFDYKTYNKVQGLPFTKAELVDKFNEILEGGEKMNHLAEEILTAKDFVTDQDVRWCPGCGDYAILKAVQNTLPQIGKNKEDIVFVSGIGCSSRFPYYIETYGFHTIHGRAPAIATGVKLANPNLSVWQVTGDGDALAIGGNHYIHALRRNIDINILLFNNEIYGLTKGQFSPTSQTGIVTKSSPQGTTDRAFNPGKLAIGAGANFFARVIDIDPKRMIEVFLEAEKYNGTSLIEILQNCVIFNDKVFAGVTDKEVKMENQLWLKHGEPMIFGAESNKGLRLNGIKLEVVTIGVNGITEKDILVHDAQCEDDTLHNMLVNISLPDFPMVFGVIRSVAAQTFNDGVWNQLNEEKSKAKFKSVNELMNSGVTWEI